MSFALNGFDRRFVVQLATIKAWSLNILQLPTALPLEKKEPFKEFQAQ